jgi:hypothetical protein
MKLKDFVRTEEFEFMLTMLNGNVLEHKDFIKAYFDTSKYYEDVELLEDIFNLIDNRRTIYGVPDKGFYLFLKVISPFTLVYGDDMERYDYNCDWARSYLKIFWTKMIEELKNKKR